jgi:hypothetical protein
VARCLVAALVVLSVAILSVAVSPSAQIAAAQRFHLTRWPFYLWALFQPVPSMYNFENRWDVAFARPEGSSADDELCRELFHGHINHHIFNRVLLRRAELERCGLPAQVHFRTDYRGTRIETVYLLTGQPGHGFSVAPATP